MLWENSSVLAPFALSLARQGWDVVGCCSPLKQLLCSYI